MYENPLQFIKSFWLEYQIMLGLADVDIDGSDEILITLLSLISTFIMTIVILNMLIALMADTYARHQRVKNTKLLEVKLELL